MYFTTYTNGWVRGRILNAGCVVANERKKARRKTRDRRNDSENLQNMMVKNESLRDSDLGFILLPKRLEQDETNDSSDNMWVEEREREREPGMGKGKIIDRKLCSMSIFYWINFKTMFDVLKDRISIFVIFWHIQGFDFWGKMIEMWDSSHGDGKSVSFSSTCWRPCSEYLLSQNSLPYLSRVISFECCLIIIEISRNILIMLCLQAIQDWQKVCSFVLTLAFCLFLSKTHLKFIKLLPFICFCVSLYPASRRRVSVCSKQKYLIKLDQIEKSHLTEREWERWMKMERNGKKISAENENLLTWLRQQAC